MCTISVVDTRLLTQCIKEKQYGLKLETVSSELFIQRRLKMTSVVLLLVTAVLAISVHGFSSEDELFVDVQSTGETFFASASNASAAAAIMHMTRYDMIAVNFLHTNQIDV